MKTIIATIATLASLSSYAVPTWTIGTQKLKMVATSTSASGFASKAAAVEAALDLAGDFQSGDLSSEAISILKDIDKNSCKSYIGGRLNLVEAQLAAGKFDAFIKTASYITLAGEEVFSYSMRLEVPCVVK